jgi:hypothetical protein
LKPETKGLIYYHVYANVANRIMLSFVWRKFSSVGIGEWWDEMKNGQKLKLGDAYITPINIQEVQASNLGDAPRHPLLHRQKSGHLSRHYIFIASCTMRISWSVFIFAFSSCCNKWLDHIMLVWRETYSIFHCQEHSSFHSYRSTSVLFFCYYI